MVSYWGGEDRVGSMPETKKVLGFVAVEIC